jgi:hypothetical protein
MGRYNCATTEDSRSGQATLELALCLPLLVFMVMGVLHVGLLVREQLQLELIVREASRAAARSLDPTATAAEVITRMRDDPSMIIEVSLLPGPVTGTEMVRVEVTTKSQTSLPLIGALLTPRLITARVTMAREPV